MTKHKTYSFNAVIYKTGINFCVDVPRKITSELTAVKGYINIKGTVNGIYFIKSLVPVKDGPYRLFINTYTIKEIRSLIGEIANFTIEQDTDSVEQQYPAPELLIARLKEKGLVAEFDALSPYKKKEVLRYMNLVKTTETLEKHIQKLVEQLENKATIRIP